jgi:hypothetical protein
MVAVGGILDIKTLSSGGILPADRADRLERSSATLRTSVSGHQFNGNRGFDVRPSLADDRATSRAHPAYFQGDVRT